MVVLDFADDRTNHSGEGMSADKPAVKGNFWEESRERRELAPALAGNASADVAIIGAGYTGLATAYHLKAADPGLDVAVLEAEMAGFGASGRNAGFVMTLFGASIEHIKSGHGPERVREAHHYMEQAIDALDAMVAEHGIDCDWQRAGFLKVATTPAYEARIRAEVQLFQSLGLRGIEWIESDQVAARVRSPTFGGAFWEPGCGTLNPVKWVDALRRLATSKGAHLYEHTRVTRVRKEGGRYRVMTPNGTLTADKVVFATNGYSHLVPGMRSKQLPAFAYIVVTEPLSDAQLATIGWEGREGIEDARNFMHFYRLTPDNRILAGGGPGLVPFGGSLDHDASPKAWAHLERFIKMTFPSLKGIRITHRWGGAFSVTSDSVPQIGRLGGDGGLLYSIGCTGHGVAMTHMNGQILRDLVLERKTGLTDLWFVGRRSFPLPPEPFRSIGTTAVTLAMALDDWWCERGGRQ
jgi:glycine/D-amino acid oxidase-like deaminating enzyme